MSDREISSLSRYRPRCKKRRFTICDIHLLVRITALILVSGALSHAQKDQYRGDIRFDIHRVPFSRFGSYLAISDTSQFQKPFDRQGVYLRTMHGGGRSIFKIELLLNGESLPFTADATPTLLTLRVQTGSVGISFDGPDSLRFRGHGISLRLIVVDGWTVAFTPERSEVSDAATKTMLWAIEGSISTSSIQFDGQAHPAITFSPEAENADFDAELDAYTTGWISHGQPRSFALVQQRERRAYLAWLKSMPSVPLSLRPGAELAAYVNWESIVEASGNLKRPAMLMSKNWMTSIWSWDQAFNAIAVSLSSSRLAWDQFMLPIDAQAPTGLFPDKWDADSFAWEFSKPPIHGWALEWMLHHGAATISDVDLAQVYVPLERWTDWFFEFRDSNRNGLPEYRHGNESGWDNSTVFRGHGLIESPDLSAYLVVQMDALADIGTRLGRPKDAIRWKRRADSLFASTMSRFWNGHAFVAFSALDGGEIASESLLLTMPLILGPRLPANVREALVADLKVRAAQSPYGLPSEPPSSPYFETDGYWRGPIWAPTTMILTDALDRIGEHSFANVLRLRFCKMAQKSGFSENFDALDGRGLRDPAYTWTSSVYLLFAHELTTEQSSGLTP